ncbi:hypothetical protein Back11_41500 [Paenibacillus baekrokdamisoli]|uniref:Uncharacterized protein n=1 Tax=Paenibacillus baekrokdamisoli TaxID=1712516 RepID=A0A3G9J376_9BACL|nr:hypothetical protein [Paenibacillus baekrokdamisoli]MBB3068150.1 hypothetical protein [Paenibacillus baekrokdamisoli]BBH22805.1 hypothetical protein Back11_41500 [Paenibacillus baekrokdamisoli]
MGTPAVILTKKEKYSPERLLADTIVAVFHADATLYFHNNKNYSEDGGFSYTTLNINNKSFAEKSDLSFIFYVHSINSSSVDFYYHEDLGLDTNLLLCQVGHIEDIYGVQELIFSFIYEYLRLNPDDYFWVADYDWVYSWEDMQKLKSLPYDPNWCYNDPKLIELT